MTYVVPLKCTVENSQNFVVFSEYINFKVSMAWQALFDLEEKSYVENGFKPSKCRKLNPSFQLERIIIEHMG